MPANGKLELAGNEARKRSQRGFVLIIMSAAAIALFGVLGMAVDIGKMFIAKNETQAYCDSAALAAALMLDGTTTGIANAQTAVANSANTWNLNSSTISNPTVTFATAHQGHGRQTRIQRPITATSTLRPQ